jgi:hypothetical protein
MRLFVVGLVMVAFEANDELATTKMRRKARSPAPDDAATNGPRATHRGGGASVGKRDASATQVLMPVTLLEVHLHEFHAFLPQYALGQIEVAQQPEHRLVLG